MCQVQTYSIFLTSSMHVSGSLLVQFRLNTRYNLTDITLDYNIVLIHVEINIKIKTYLEMLTNGTLLYNFNNINLKINFSR